MLNQKIYDKKIRSIYNKNDEKTKLDKCVEYLTRFWWQYYLHHIN